MTTRVRCLFCGEYYGFLGKEKHMKHKREIRVALKGRVHTPDQSYTFPYRTSQSLELRSIISKLGKVVGYGWEGNDFVVHVV